MGGLLNLNLRVALVILSVILSLPSSSDGSLLLSISKDGDLKSLGRRKTMMGSRPPDCVNQCSSCRPCVPTLVVSGWRSKSAMGEDGGNDADFLVDGRIRGHEEENGPGYYLLTWKCKCGNKIYDPYAAKGGP
ncbi:hypothetical protein SAY86_026378 [Trapa natans]|uniref:Epidermal patterning factor-like protein n=1 Tax=Trapa natans TaxID=22666 RepID=A0AAN7QEZ6_TRANT|nr:hypothetical protein SAY86_026378 [Trapa natans]